MQAQQEELGDLKLYRIRAGDGRARSQKQVALLQQPRVQVRTVYRQRFYPAGQVMRSLANRFFITRNRREDGLGLPPPAGRLTLFDEESGRQVLVGEAVMRDFALNEDVEIDGHGARHHLGADLPPVRGKDQVDYEVVVTNDRPNPVAYELELAVQPAQVRSETRLGRQRHGALEREYPGHWQRDLALPGGPALSERQDLPICPPRLVGYLPAERPLHPVLEFPLHRPRLVILVQRHEGEEAVGHFTSAAAVAGGDHVDADRDRGAADPLDLGIDRDQVVQQDGGDEGHRLDRDGGDRAVRPRVRR